MRNYICDIDNESALILQLKNGSYEAFNKIYHIYAKRLYAYCLQFTKQPENTEEIVQDIFVKLWLNRENIKQVSTLRSLLFIMAKNDLINAFRSKVRQPIYEEYVDYREKLSVNDTGQNIEYQEFVSKLHRVIQMLPSTMRKVIILSKMQQLSNKEIAERLHLSEQTVRNTLSMGLKKLKEAWDKTYLLYMLLFIKIMELLGIN